MRRIFLSLVFFIALITTAMGQTVDDAVRYSLFDIVGTARSIGLANAMSGIGGDFSVISQNPAGLAVLRSSEFVFTPAFFSTRTDADFIGASATNRETTNRFVVPSLGFIISSRPRSSKWKTSNLAIGINRIGDYHQAYFFSGSTPGSITDRWLELADGIPPTNFGGFEESLAWGTGAIYDLDQDLIYESDYSMVDGVPLYKEQFVETIGGNTELLFSYAANYHEKLLFGFSVGVPIIRFESTKVYIEQDAASDEVPFFNRLEYEEFLETTGAGVNFKLGLLYKVNKWANVGFAVHSPTNYGLTDDYFTRLVYDYTDSENDGPIEDFSPDGNFRYRLRTPWTTIGSFGFVIPKRGLVTAEIQWSDYSRTQFDYTSRGNGDAFISEERAINNQIRDQLGSAFQMRFGGELAFDRIGVRAGIGLHQNPYADSDRFDMSYQGGVGFKTGSLYLYLGYQHRAIERAYQPYFTSNAAEQRVNLNSMTNRILMSFRLKF